MYLGLNMIAPLGIWTLIISKNKKQIGTVLRILAKLCWRDTISSYCSNMKTVRDPTKRKEFEPERLTWLQGRFLANTDVIKVAHGFYKK